MDNQWGRQRRRWLGAGAGSALLALAGCAGRAPAVSPGATPARPAAPTRTDRAARAVPALRAGAQIAVVSPASAVSGAPEAAARWLESRGYSARLMTSQRLDAPFEYLAGPDSLRLAQLHSAFADPQIDAIWCLQGGFGSWRLLPQLDYALIRENPKPFIGYSDITALHLALQRQAGFVTFHGPMPGQDFRFGRNEPTESLTWAMLNGELGQGSWIEAPGDSPLMTLASGTASGRLVGGNLALISALMGTPYEIDTEDAILFFEDVNELPARVDRMLAQLKASGKLRQAAGVLIGTFTRGASGNAYAAERCYQPLMREIFQPLGIPVLAGWPSGHGDPNLILPLGARVTLDAERGALRLDQAVVAAPTTAARFPQAA